MLQIHTELSQIPCMNPGEDSVLLDHPSGLIRVYAVCSIILCSLGPLVQSKLFITSLVITEYSISDIKLLGTDLFPLKFPLYNRIFT